MSFSDKSGLPELPATGNQRRPRRSAVARGIWGTLGVLAIALGFIGIFVPGLPTTPFVLVAAACFSRSSDRLNRWLRHHPRFGHLIRDWEDGGRIRRKSKVSALVVMAAGMIVAAIFLKSQPVLLAGTLLTVSAVALFVWRRPE